MTDKAKPGIPQVHAQTILNSIADGLFTVDKDMIITHFNSSAERITQVSKDEAMGRYCYQVFQSHICSTQCPLKCSVETGQKWINQNNKILRADNREIPISLSTAVIKDEEGNVLGGVETFRDLSNCELLNSRKTTKNKLPGISPLNNAERNTIIETLNRNNWIKSRTARELGLDRTTLWRKMKKLEISSLQWHFCITIFILCCISASLNILFY